MIKPPTPVDELLRLESLRNLKILDTDPEERFDRLTRLATKIFNTPIALVSLVDRDRQWFKSSQGLCASETPREISFCGHAIYNDEVLVVADATTDERFADNPLVTGEPNVRFYAGCPVKGPDGRKVGTLCLIDTKPRGMMSGELELLRDLGKMVEDELIVADFLRVDPTTGLSNKAGFTEIARPLLASFSRHHLPATLALFDHVDYASVCAADGVDVGERAAIELTQLLLASFRESDVVGRLSPDTYAVLLAGAQHEHFDGILEKFDSHLANRNKQRGAGYTIQVNTNRLPYDAEIYSTADAYIHAALRMQEDEDESVGDGTTAVSA